jgi:hypothetical protein
MRVERRAGTPDGTPDQNTQDMVAKYLVYRAAAQELLNRYSPEVKVNLDEGSNTLLKVVHVGDTHYFHDDAEPTALLEALKQAGKEGLVVLHANVLDGVSNKFLANNTIAVGGDLDTQIAMVRAVLKEHDEAGLVIALSLNKCHEGWARSTATFDPTLYIVKPNTPILYSGGQIMFKTKTGKTVGVLEVYHNSGKGRTNLSPEGADRARGREVPFGHPNRPDAVIDAHYHQLVAGQDVTHNPIDNQDHVTTMGMVGTAKGTKEKPDRFLVSLGVPPRNQPADAGQGLVTIWRKNGDPNHLSNYPVAGYDRASFLFDAFSLLENTERRGITEALQQEILESGRFPKPRKSLRREECQHRHKDTAALSEGKAPLFKKVAFNISTNLPIMVQFIGNLRVGATTLERGAVQTLLKEINNNPWAYFFATRRLINLGVARDPNREKIVKTMAGLLATARRSLLGIMLTDELRTKAWSKPINSTGEDGEKIKIESFYPGDWLYYKSALKGIPLIMPEAFFSLNLSDLIYILYIKDRLSHFTSLINTFHGLTRVQQVFGIQADALIGGDTEVVGWRTWMQPAGQLETIVPGGFSEYIGKGIGNRVDYPTGGQGLIMFPERKLLYSFATIADGRDMHTALWLYFALKKMGKLKKVLS